MTYRDDITSHPLYHEQVKLEEESRGLGVAKYLQDKDHHIESQQEDRTTYGRQLIKGLLPALIDAITEWQTEREEATKKARGVMKSDVYEALKGVPKEIVAFLTLRTLVSHISTSQLKLTSIATNLGRAIETEAKVRALRNADHQGWSHLVEKTRKAQHMGAKMKAVRQVTEQNEELEWDGWTTPLCARIGAQLIGIVQHSTRLVKIGKTMHPVRRNKTISVVEATDETKDWLFRKGLLDEAFAASHYPMVVPPAPWKSLRSGGYVTTHVPSVPFIRGWTDKKLALLEDADLSRVFEATNAVQNTQWRVNQRVLDVMKWAWEEQTGTLPPLDDKPITRMDDEVWAGMSKEERKAVNKVNFGIHADNRKNFSRRLSVLALFRVADRVKEFPAIYFPHSLDFRGRLYSVPQHLSPQGPDHSKALLEFANAKPCDSRSAFEWLCVHIANLYGVDKVSFSDRVSWVKERGAEFQAAAADPRSNRSTWEAADKPWQALAALFAFADATKGLPIRLPIAMDGTCNGLQHLSAMLLDPVGATATNLEPADAPQDIYQIVADRAREVMEAEAGRPEAAGWLALGVDRKMTKRSVMTVPYGVTSFTIGRYIQNHFAEKKGLGLTEDLFPDEKRAMQYAAKLVEKSIDKTVVAARKAMKWLQEVAKIVSDQAVPLHWVTPLGFPVVQNYFDYEMQKIDTVLAGAVRIRMDVQALETNNINPRRQVNGVAPNFVHSMDATALMLTIQGLTPMGVTDFGLVHDSYATHAADCDLMFTVIRAAFVELYRENHLEKFREQAQKIVGPDIEIPPPPAQGSFDIEQVHNSLYFFS